MKILKMAALPLIVGVAVALALMGDKPGNTKEELGIAHSFSHIVADSGQHDLPEGGLLVRPIVGEGSWGEGPIDGASMMCWPAEYYKEGLEGSLFCAPLKGAFKFNPPQQPAP